MPDIEKSAEPVAPNAKGEASTVGPQKETSTDGGKARREERKRLEEWSKECEQMEDRDLLHEIRQRNYAIDYLQRSVGAAAKDSPQRVSELLADIAFEEKQFQVAKDVFAERKGLKKLSPEELRTLAVTLEKDAAELTRSLRNTDAQKYSAHHHELSRDLEAAETQARIVDENLLGVQGKSEQQLLAVIQSLKRSADSPATSRQLVVVREEHARRRGLTTLPPQRLEARKRQLEAARQQYLRMDDEIRQQGRGSLTTDEWLKQQNEQLRAIHEQLTPADEELASIAAIIRQREKRKGTED